MKQEIFIYESKFGSSNTVFDYMQELINKEYHIDCYHKEGKYWSILATKQEVSKPE